jgi:hypothetical protein
LRFISTLPAAIRIPSLPASSNSASTDCGKTVQ